MTLPETQTRRIYLDNSATTRVADAVVAAMLPFFTEQYGNASSLHQWGQRARQAIEDARGQVAALLGADKTEITFLSGGTEANNLAIKGIAESINESAAAHGRHIITSQIEHPAVLNPCAHLEKQGWRVTYLPVYGEGIVRMDDVRAALTDETTLITLMLANNEIGTLQPIREIGALVRARRAAGQKHLWLHTDAVQAVGKIPLDVRELGVDLLSLSAHKIHGPKGIGALYVRKGVRLRSQMHGGHHERDRRAGTEAVPLIVGLGKAAELAATRLDEYPTRVRALRDHLESEILRGIPDTVRNGAADHRLPHIASVSFAYVEGEGLMISLDLKGIAVSTGSACSSGSLEPSHVLLAIGLPSDTGRGSLRFSLGLDTTAADIAHVLETLAPLVEKLRRLSPLARKKADQSPTVDGRR
ncbi:MAG: cysteine desulfurase NifS [Blastocatellia bacterium]